MKHSRRKFLQTSLGTSALLSVGLSAPDFLLRSARATALAGNTGQRILVVVQLAGGNDGLNTVIPYADEAYNKNRIVLRVARDSVLKVNDQLGLHPQMGGFAKLLENHQLAIVQGIGYPNPDRSHFRSMDIWHSAQPEIATPRDGWLGRRIERLPDSTEQDVPALHLGASELPLALASERRAVPSLESLENFRLRTENGAVAMSALNELAAAQRGTANPLLSFMQRSTLTAYASSQQVQEALKDDRSPVKYPGFGLARKLQNVAQLIDAGLSTSIYYVSLDGFDTHANQGEAHGALLNELAASLQAFVEDLSHRGHLDRVAVLSFSEFGRRVRENASYGTDHGAAAPVFLIGGKVNSGPIGAHPSLTDLDQEGDMKFHTDFRQLYATLLDQWLGCPSQEVLGAAFAPIAAFKT